MMTLIIKSYLAILLSVSMVSLLVFIMGIYWITKKVAPAPDQAAEAAKDITEEIAVDKKAASKKSITISSQDISAISGGDVMITQLDLARAYIETDRKQLAKKILEFVIHQGTHAQREEAQRLLSYI